MLSKDKQVKIYKTSKLKYIGTLLSTGILGFFICSMLIAFLLVMFPEAFREGTSLTVTIPMLMFSALNIYVMIIGSGWLKKAFVLALRGKDEALKDHAIEKADEETDEDLWKEGLL